MIPQPDKTPGDISWFLEARFGMFIHWGTYAAAARHEWVKKIEQIPDEEYHKYFDHFDPDLYNPEIWAKEAANAGMKYMVVTSKHHEGFCMWDSALTDYKAPNTPAKKDLLKPMLDAFRKKGLRVGTYHSLLDWHHPEYPIDGIHPMHANKELREQEKDRDVRKYAAYLHGQVKELLTDYGPLSVMWFDFSYSDLKDGGKGKNEWQSEKLIKMIRKIAPKILINDRLEIPQDFITPEQEQPRKWPTGGQWAEDKSKPVYWEACQTVNESWGYFRNNADKWKSVDFLVKLLIDTVSKGGNLLLNVGPNARGELEPNAIERLRGIGEWMHLHDNSIYGCGPSEIPTPQDCRLTQKGNRLYVHMFSYPPFVLNIDGLTAEKVEYAQFLNDASELKFNTEKRKGEKAYLKIHLPVQAPPVTVPVIELFLK